jgi:hypothetical protein
MRHQRYGPILGKLHPAQGEYCLIAAWLKTRVVPIYYLGEYAVSP